MSAWISWSASTRNSRRELGAEQQFPRGGVEIADVHQDRVAGQDGQRGGDIGHHLRL